MEPRVTTVFGGFERNGQPVQGLVRFTPSRLWVVCEGTTWACLAPSVLTDQEGNFSIQVTATDNDAVRWHYKVESPAGIFKLYVPDSRSALSLGELINGYRVGSSPAERQ